MVLGGTFDRLHSGHKKLLLTSAMLASESLTVGVTSEEMLKKKANASHIQPYDQRAQAVCDFVAAVKPGLEVHIAKLYDPWGPTTTSDMLEAIVVSSETLSGGHKINELREATGLAPLDVIVIQRDNAAVISSSFLRVQSRM